MSSSRHEHGRPGHAANIALVLRAHGERVSPLLFALADAWLWGQWRPTFDRRRRNRANARRINDIRMMAVWDASMRMARLFACGAWRSLWGVL